MRFAIFGAGGVGGYFGARLAADGNEVVFIARGAHGEAMARQGLRLRSVRGDLYIEKPEVHADTAAVGRCDYVLVCVKMGALAEAAEAIRPLLADDTAVVPFQNGIESEDILGRALGPRFVLGGVAYIFAHIAEPGVIQHVGEVARLAFGELDGRKSSRMETLESACIGAGIDVDATDRIEDRLWRKFVTLAPLAGATCLGRCPVGGVRDDPVLFAKLEAMIAEAVALGRARGVELPDDLTARSLKAVGELQADMKTSMLHDLEAGKPLELDWLNGAIVRLGAEAGVPTPVNAEVVAALSPYAAGKT